MLYLDYILFFQCVFVCVVTLLQFFGLLEHMLIYSLHYSERLFLQYFVVLQ